MEDSVRCTKLIALNLCGGITFYIVNSARNSKSVALKEKKEKQRGKGERFFPVTNVQCLLKSKSTTGE